jgi:F0F1-type ATP synthase membrane subunit b/b'
MIPQLKLLRAVFLACVVFLGAVLVQATEEVGSANHVMSQTSFKWVHFLILTILAYWLFAKVLPSTFRHRADNISSAITKATAAKAEAERQLKEAAGKLASLESEVARFRAQAQKDAAAELERLRAMTKMDAEKMGLAAKAEIEAAERAARVELKELAAKLAMDRAESLVAKELTPALQEAMLNDFVQRLQGRPK